MASSPIVEARPLVEVGIAVEAVAVLLRFGEAAPLRVGKRSVRGLADGGGEG